MSNLDDMAGSGGDVSLRGCAGLGNSSKHRALKDRAA